MSGPRQRIIKLEAEAAALQDAPEQTRSIQLVTCRLETLGTVLQALLDRADWAMPRDVIRTLLRRIEIESERT